MTNNTRKVHRNNSWSRQKPSFKQRTVSAGKKAS